MSRLHTRATKTRRMSRSSSPRKSFFLALLQPAGAAIGAVFAFGVLMVATQEGQFASIASFGAGAGTAALASVAVGGGTTFAYTTGAAPRQRAVRIVRGTIVLPSIVLATALAVLLYAGLGNLDPLGVVAGGLSTCASVGAELDASYLRRHLRTGRLLVADTINRVIAFGLIVFGVPFAFAMLGGAISRMLLLWVFTRADPSRERTLRITRSTLALAYEFKLTSLSVLYSLCDRIGALTAPAASPIPVAGGFVAVLSAQQNASGVLITGLQTTLAARSQQRSQLSWANRLDLLFVAFGVAAAAAMIAWQVPLTEFLGLGTASEPGQYWVAVALLIPASIASRCFEFRFLTTSASGKAVAARAVAASVAIGAAAIAVVGAEIAVLASGLLVAEIASVLVSVGLVLTRYIRMRRGRNRA